VPAAVAEGPFARVESLRGIAATAVLTTHATIFIGAGVLSSAGLLFLNAGTQGVAIFFVISGFVLYRPLLQSRWLGATPRPWSQWASRRAARIIPAYWLALTVLALWPGLPGVFDHDWWRYYGLLQVYSEDTSQRGLGVAWTLCVEVTYYAFLPFYAIAMTKIQRRHPWNRRIATEAGGLAILVVVAVSLQAILFANDRSGLTATLPATVDWFALGMAIALLAVWRESATAWPSLLAACVRRPIILWCLAAAIFAVASLGLGLPRTVELHPEGPILKFVIAHVMFGAAAALTVAAAVLSPLSRDPLSRLLETAPLRFLGLVSFGLYLWHAPVAAELARHGGATVIPYLPTVSISLLTLTVSTLLAAMSFYLLERPVLRARWSDLRGPRASGAGATSPSSRLLSPRARETAPRPPRRGGVERPR